jgi:hypothetical protein
MSLAQRTSAAEAFWADEEAADDQVQAAMLIAQQKKFRPKTVFALDLARKAKHLASLHALSDPLAARVLVTYHLAARRPMMGAFLDALGITHENGVIQADEVKPDTSKLDAAAADLTARYPADDVALYFQTLLCQDPQTWGALTSQVARLKAQSGGDAAAH